MTQRQNQQARSEPPKNKGLWKQWSLPPGWLWVQAPRQSHRARIQGCHLHCGGRPLGPWFPRKIICKMLGFSEKNLVSLQGRLKCEMGHFFKYIDETIFKPWYTIQSIQVCLMGDTQILHQIIGIHWEYANHGPSGSQTWVVKHGNAKCITYRILQIMFILKPPFLKNFPSLNLITGGYVLSIRISINQPISRNEDIYGSNMFQMFVPPSAKRMA